MIYSVRGRNASASLSVWGEFFGCARDFPHFYTLDNHRWDVSYFRMKTRIYCSMKCFPFQLRRKLFSALFDFACLMPSLNNKEDFPLIWDEFFPQRWRSLFTIRRRRLLVVASIIVENFLRRLNFTFQDFGSFRELTSLTLPWYNLI